MARIEAEQPRTADYLVASRFFYDTSKEAVSALEAVGARYDPRLDLTVHHPLGVTLQRRFGVLGNVLDDRMLDHPVVRAVQRALTSSVNQEVVEELRRRRLSFTPVNKRLVQELLLTLHEARVHLPWSFWPMNYDLAARMSEVFESGDGFPFEVFYSQFVELYPGRGEGFGLAKTGRTFSLPISMSAHGTWQETAFGALDIDVGLVVEANVLGEAEEVVEAPPVVRDEPLEDEDLAAIDALLSKL